MNSKSSNIALQEKKYSISPSTKSKNMLLAAFESAKRELDYLSKNESRFSITPLKSHSQGNPEQTKMKKNDRLLKLKAEERKQERKAYQIYKQQIQLAYEDHRNDHKSSSSHMASNKISNAKHYKQQMEKLEEEYSQSIQEKIRDKMERYSANYSSHIQKKKEVLYMMRTRAQSVNRAYESPREREKDAILKIIAKRLDSEKRKHIYLDELHEKLRRNHEKKEKKLASAKEFVVKKERLLLKRSLDIEKRLKSCQNLIINQKQDISNKIKMKLEKERLKEDIVMKKHEKQKMTE